MKSRPGSMEWIGSASDGVIWNGYGIVLYEEHWCIKYQKRRDFSSILICLLVL
jgi:hypothetical protein